MNHINWQQGDIPSTVDGDGGYCMALVLTEHGNVILCEFYPQDCVDMCLVDVEAAGFHVGEDTSTLSGYDYGERICGVQRWALIG